MLDSNIIIKVVITEPPGTACRKLIYNAGLVTEKLGLECPEIINGDSVNLKTDEHILPPFLLIGDLVLGKDISLERLEQIIKKSV